MHGIPTTMLTHVLAVDWLLDRVDGFCKVSHSKCKITSLYLPDIIRC